MAMYRLHLGTMRHEPLDHWVHDPRLWVLLTLGIFALFSLITAIVTGGSESGILATPFYSPYWPFYTNG